MKIPSLKNSITIILMCLLFEVSAIFGQSATINTASCCNALCCDSFDVQVQAGAAPIVWVKDSSVRTFFGTSDQSPVLKLFESPKFHDFFKQPWFIGMQIGYALTDSVRLYTECNYYQAKGKNEVSVDTITTPVFPVTLEFDTYKLFDAHLGIRYYSDRMCQALALFCGAKFGVAYQRAIEGDLILETAPPFRFIQITLLDHNTFLSGGANIGIDICLCSNISLVITAEVVASGAPKRNDLFFRVPLLDRFTSTSLGDIAAEVKFPVSAAIRYTF